MSHSIQSTALFATIVLSCGGIAPRAEAAWAEGEPGTDAPKPPEPTRKRILAGAGLDTQAVTVGGAADVGDSSSEKDWGFKFKGFMRAPMRVGISRSVPPANTASDVHQNDLQFHSIPVTPDGNYTRWAFTNIAPGPWAELLFQYGNQRVMMTTSIASYNITSGGWRELQDQLGIDRAFITLKFPEALGNVGGMAWDVGIFSNRYGAMGKYDGGEYETYLIGRTRVAGATATADLEVGDDTRLILEGGVGAKVDQQYQTYRGSDSVYTATYDYPTWQPYPGNKVQQGSNVLAHFHVGAVLAGMLTLEAHYIGSFVKDARWNVGTTGGTSGTYPSDGSVPGYGYIQVGGLDLKLDGGWRGDGYLGYSYVKAKNALTVNDSIEVLHSQGGWQLAQNYFPDGNGAIHSVAGQYTFSLAAMLMRPRPFWGQAADLTVRPFFMFNRVTGTTGGTQDVSKLKYGLDTVYAFMPMMAIGLRFDVVSPTLSDSTQTFMAWSPRLIFRSEFVTHETIVLQYSYYHYGSAYTDPSRSDSVMPWPFGQFATLSTAKLQMQPDQHVVTLYASMWW